LHHPEGKALTYRFKKDEKGWRVFISCSIAKPKTLSRNDIGVIGIDLNTDHIACIETDRFGNCIAHKVIPWNSYGKTKGQLKALTGEVCKELIDWGHARRKPLVIENLDFQKKKLQLRQEKDSFARLLSSFAYNLFHGFLIARAYKYGIEIHKVNPAFTSVIGSVNYAKRYGLSTHLAAALCIARRYQQFSESPCSSYRTIPDGRGAHVAFDLPERNRTKHVWHFWRQVSKKKITVLAAHHRASPPRSSSPIHSTRETKTPDGYQWNPDT
jgi:IS605 OrfB family transposase